MAITFGDNQYGKAEVRLVHITRDGDRHQIKDLNVSSALRGDFADAHLAGDNAKVVATDTQKNTVYAFAQQYGWARSRSSRCAWAGISWTTSSG